MGKSEALGLAPLLVQKVEQKNILRKEEPNLGQLNEHNLPVCGAYNFFLKLDKCNPLSLFKMCGEMYITPH